MSKETGGPAFPVPTAGDTAGFVDAEECGVPTGLTIRDYFAAKAMAVLLADGCIARHGFGTVAEHAFLMANQMLAARNN